MTAFEIVHACPPKGSDRTRCCDRSPFELPMTDRITLDQLLVTCAPGLMLVPRSFVESVLYSGSFDRAQLDDLHRRAQELLDG